MMKEMMKVEKRIIIMFLITTPLPLILISLHRFKIVEMDVVEEIGPGVADEVI
jgi:hypothetical protein